ncbi:MAG: hypothetical protein AAB263_10020 [Planctomycetota bacterium]
MADTLCAKCLTSPPQRHEDRYLGLDTWRAQGYTLAVSSYIRLVLIVLITSTAAMSSAAEQPNPLDQADTVLRIRDGAWVEREASKYAAAYGTDLVLMRGELARALYRSTSLAGIDLKRPAVIAWRKGKAPLLAAIPINNRADFLNSFGAVDGDDPPLVRTGERDGTVIYTQNQSDGLWEYRLLVVGNVAYMARTQDECRRMAAANITQQDEQLTNAVEMTFRGPAIAKPRLPGAPWLACLPSLPIELSELSLVPGLARGILGNIAEQMSSLSIVGRSSASGDLQLAVRIAAKPDTTLATWIAQQHPTTERIANQLRSPATAILVNGRFSFQGQVERWAFDQVDGLKATAKDHWTQQADASYRSLCTLIERTGAWAIAAERIDGSLLQTSALEHPRSVEVIQSYAQLIAALRASACESVQFGDHAGYRVLLPFGSGLFSSGDRHALRIDEHGANRGQPFLLETLRRLDNQGKLEDVPVLANIWMDLALAWNAPALVNPDGEQERPEPVVITGNLRPAGPGKLECVVNIPLPRVAAMLARINKPIKNDR